MIEANYIPSAAGDECPYPTEVGVLGDDTEVYYRRDGRGVCVESEKFGMTFCKDFPDEGPGGDWLSYPTERGGGCEFSEYSAVYVGDWEASNPDEIEAVLNALCDQPEAIRFHGEIWWPRQYMGVDQKTG
jgi:hypothetical protein